MQRKTKEVNVVQKVTVFVADDGREFDDERECEKHDDCLKREKFKSTVEHSFEAEGMPNINGCEAIEYHDYRWCKPKSTEEIDVMNDVYNFCVPYDMVGKWICIEAENNCEGIGWWSALEEGIDYAKRLFSALGYTMTVEKKETDDEGNR